MDTTTALAPTRPAPAPAAGDPRMPARRRWPYAGPGQLRLLLAALGVTVGSFMPWVDTAFGSFTGLAGPGLWTLYAGILGIAGAMVRRRRLAAVHAGLTGLVAVAMAVWQGLRVADLCGGGACTASTGLFMVGICGVVALTQVVPILRFQPEAT